MNTISMPETLEVEPVNETVKLEWRAPIITQIDIKKTMFGSGSKDDGLSSASFSV